MGKHIQLLLPRSPNARASSVEWDGSKLLSMQSLLYAGKGAKMKQSVFEHRIQEYLKLNVQNGMLRAESPSGRAADRVESVMSIS